MCAKVFPAVPTQSAPFEKTDPLTRTLRLPVAVVACRAVRAAAPPRPRPPPPAAAAACGRRVGGGGCWLRALLPARRVVPPG